MLIKNLQKRIFINANFTLIAKFKTFSYIFLNSYIQCCDTLINYRIYSKDINFYNIYLKKS